MSAVRFKDEKQWSAFLAQHRLTERNGEAGRARVRLPKLRLKAKLPHSIALWWFCGVCLLWNLPLAVYSPWAALGYSIAVFGGLFALKQWRKSK